MVSKCALTPDDVTRYDLPSDFTKHTDTRRASFVARYGDVAVELDALLVDVLRQRLVEEVEARIDMDVLFKTQQTEKRELNRLEELLGEAE